jgi:hypothetical protein
VSVTVMVPRNRCHVVIRLVIAPRRNLGLRGTVWERCWPIEHAVEARGRPGRSRSTAGVDSRCLV